MFALIAAAHGTAHNPKELWNQSQNGRDALRAHKLKLGYLDAEALRRGARELLGTAERPGQNP
jgi:hypothetical protein